MSSIEHNLISVSSLSDDEIVHFIAVYQGFLIRYRGYPRKPFRQGGKPRKYMAAATLQCHKLGLSPKRYVGILFGRYCKYLGRREPSPQMLASLEALQIVKGFLEQEEAAQATSTVQIDLESSIRASTVRHAGGMP